MNWNLLLIDDEPCILDTLAELLTDDDITVTKAKNGQEGLTLLKEKHFDVVVTDVSMPVMDGPSMFFHAKAAGIFTPHIFFTASSSAALNQSLKMAGAHAVVPKPCFEKLSAEINSILVKKELMRISEFLPIETSLLQVL